MFEQYCSHLKQCNNNIVTLFCAKNRRCESSRLKSTVVTLSQQHKTAEITENLLPVQYSEKHSPLFINIAHNVIFCHSVYQQHQILGPTA